MQGETESVITQRIDKNAAPRSKAADVLMRELRHFGTVFLYLAVVFGVFALHAFVVLADNGMSYQFYGASIINAVILAKILHVAEAFHFGEKFTGVRHVAGRCLCRRGSWRRPHSRQKSRREQAHLGGGTLAGIAAIAVIMCVTLVPFFAFKEIRRAYGGAGFDALIFRDGSA